LLQQQQSAFYEELRADIIAEQGACRQDISHGLAQIKAEMQSHREANTQIEAQVNVQPLIECVRREVREAMSKTDTALHNGIMSVMDSVSRIEASMRRIDVKPELDLKPIDDRIARIELKAEMSTKSDLEAVKNAMARIEDELRKNMDVLPLLETIKANQASPRFTVDMQPKVNLSPVLDSIDKLHASIADVARHQNKYEIVEESVLDSLMKIDGSVEKIVGAVSSDLQKCHASVLDNIATIRCKQDDVVAVVKELPQSKFQIELNPLMDLNPLMEATERVSRQIADMSKKPQVDMPALNATLKEISKKSQDDLQAVRKSITSISDVQRTNGMSVMDELAKLAAAQLEHKFALELKSQVDLKPVLYGLAKLEQKVDKIQRTSVAPAAPQHGYAGRSAFESTPTFAGLEQGGGSGSSEGVRSLEKELSDVLTLSGTSIGNNNGSL
jgi:hypothetical protein